MEHYSFVRRRRMLGSACTATAHLRRVARIAQCDAAASPVGSLLLAPARSRGKRAAAGGDARAGGCLPEVTPGRAGGYLPEVMLGRAGGCRR